MSDSLMAFTPAMLTPWSPSPRPTKVSFPNLVSPVKFEAR